MHSIRMTLQFFSLLTLVLSVYLWYAWFSDQQKLLMSSSWKETAGTLTHFSMSSSPMSLIPDSMPYSVRQWDPAFIVTYFFKPATAEYVHAAGKTDYRGEVILQPQGPFFLGEKLSSGSGAQAAWRSAYQFRYACLGEAKHPMVRYDSKAPQVSVLVDLVSEHMGRMLMWAAITSVVGLVGLFAVKLMEDVDLRTADDQVHDAGYKKWVQDKEND